MATAIDTRAAQIRIWDIESAPTNPLRSVTLRKRLIGSGSAITALFMTANEVISGHADGKIFMWDAEAGDHGVVLQVLEGHTGGITCLSAESTRVVSGSQDKTIMVRLAKVCLGVTL